MEIPVNILNIEPSTRSSKYGLNCNTGGGFHLQIELKQQKFPHTPNMSFHATLKNTQANYLLFSHKVNLDQSVSPGILSQLFAFKFNSQAYRGDR